MKNKILTALIVLTILMIAGGVYIMRLNQNVVHELQNIIALHEVEYLRKTLISQLRIVQSDLLLKDSPHARDITTFVEHVEEMGKTAATCSTCHKDEKGQDMLHEFYTDFNTYKKELSRVYTIRANEARLRQVKERAFGQGQHVLDEIGNLVVRLDSAIGAKVNQASGNILRAKQLLILFLFTSPFVVFGAAFIFLRHYTSAVTALTKATRKLKEGNLDYRVESGLKDEFGELALSFNQMADSIKGHYAEMQRAERLAVAGELAAGIAHEVKNPLAGIKVSIEVMQSELELAQEEREIFLQVVNEIKRIELLLKELLNYARPPRPQMVPLGVGKVVERAIQNARYSLKKPLAENLTRKKITFEYNEADEVPEIIADPDQLQQVFLNLLINAIDAIEDTGVIKITVSCSAEFVEVEISDSGEGMSPEALEKIFTPFFTTKSKGTGLGLSICKRLIEQHSGTIEAVSNPEGGMSFVVTLPASEYNGDQL